MSLSQYMSDQQIQEIESLLKSKELELNSIKPRNILEPVVPKFENYEETMRQDYLARIPEDERKRMKFGSTKRFKDSIYEGDLLGEKRHGLGRMTYENGRNYFGE